MTLEESYESIGDDDDMAEWEWLEHLEGVKLEELRHIRKAMGHDVEAEEQKFLEMLKQRGLLKDKTEVL